MDEIRDWTRSRGLTKKFRNEIIKHFEYAFARVTICQDELEMLSHLPPQLRLKVILNGSMHKGIADGITRSFQGLSDDALLAELVIRLKPSKIQISDTLLHTGDIVEQVYFLKTGKVKMSIVEEHTRPIMVGLFSAGCSLCMYETLNRKNSMYMLMAATTVELWALEASDFIGLLRCRAHAYHHFEEQAARQYLAITKSLESDTIVSLKDQGQTKSHAKVTLKFTRDSPPFMGTS